MRFMGLELSDIKGLISLEVGGANGMINVSQAAFNAKSQSLVAASHIFDIPLVDGDFMVRRSV